MFFHPRYGGRHHCISRKKKTEFSREIAASYKPQASSQYSPVGAIPRSGVFLAACSLRLVAAFPAIVCFPVFHPHYISFSSMEKKLPTIKEIARRLNISASTVSRALHDHPSIG